jgi:hypothetical protein
MEMVVRQGWRTVEMLKVYAHLTCRDVDEKELHLRGYKTIGQVKVKA